MEWKTELAGIRWDAYESLCKISKMTDEERMRIYEALYRMECAADYVRLHNLVEIEELARQWEEKKKDNIFLRAFHMKYKSNFTTERIIEGLSVRYWISGPDEVDRVISYIKLRGIALLLEEGSRFKQELLLRSILPLAYRVEYEEYAKSQNVITSCVDQKIYRWINDERQTQGPFGNIVENGKLRELLMEMPEGKMNLFLSRCQREDIILALSSVATEAVLRVIKSLPDELAGELLCKLYENRSDYSGAKRGSAVHRVCYVAANMENAEVIERWLPPVKSVIKQESEEKRTESLEALIKRMKKKA